MIDYDKLQFNIPSNVKYKNSYLEGKRTEKLFLDICESNNYNCEKSDDYNDIYQHFDFKVIINNNVKTRIDVKSEKRLNRNDKNISEDIQWLELKGVSGYDGWLYGKSTHIAFRMKYKFLIFKRKDLLEFALKNRKYDSNNNPIFCKSDNKQFYETLQRDGKQDEVVLVKISDLLDKLECRIFKFK